MIQVTEAIKFIKEALTSRWIWIIPLFFSSMLASTYLAFAYGFLAALAPYFWIYLLVLREILRQRKLSKACGVYGSDRWEIPFERHKQSIEEYVESMKKPRHSMQRE